MYSRMMSKQRMQASEKAASSHHTTLWKELNWRRS